MIKKIIIGLITAALVYSCINLLDEDKLVYNSYVEELKELKKTNTAKEIVDVDIELEKSENNEITYRVTIDNPKEEMKDVEAIVYHNEETQDTYPSVGVFNEKVNLIPGLEENDNEDKEEVVLIGHIKTKELVENLDPTMKVMILYNNEDNERQKIYYTKTL